MTAYSPGALATLKKEIAHKAIQRFMTEKQWYGTPEKGFRSNIFDEILPGPTSGPTGTVRIKHRMTMMGSGSGEAPPGAKYIGQTTEHSQIVYTYEVDPWTSIYEPWIENIETAFHGWDTLPEPGDFDGPVEAMRAAVGSLTPYPDAGTGGDMDGDKFTSVDLATDIDTIHTWLGPDVPGAYTGAIIYAFYTKYGAERIKGVLNNQAQLAIMLGTTLLGEKKVWEKAREDIMILGGDAKKVFDVTAGGVGGFDLKVVKALGDLLGEFVPAPFKPVLTVGMKSLGLIEALMPPKDQSAVNTKITGDTADAILSSMRDELRKLDAQIMARENELNDSVQKLLDLMGTMPASNFHIHAEAGVDPGMREPERISVNSRTMGDLGYNVIPRIASTMGRAAEKAHGADKPFIWQRTYVGVLPNGPYPNWLILLGELDKVATGSASELVEAGELLAKAGQGLRETDEQTEGAMKGLEDELARGKGQHGYTPYKPPPPPKDEHPGPGGPI